MSENEVALIPKESALTVFTTSGGMDPILAKVRAEIDGFKADLTTAKGRTAIASFARKVASFKVQIDEIGKTLADEQKEIPKKIDAERKRVRDTLDQWKEEVRAPLTEWELTEAARIAGLNQRVAGLEAIALNLESDNAVTLADKLELTSNALIDDSWQEFKIKAMETKANSVRILTAAHGTAVQNEADAAELLRLRNEAAARIRRENEERIAREAAEAATKAAEAVAKAAAEKAEREAAERLAASEKAAKDQREAAERKAKQEEEAAAKREADLKAAQEKAERERKEAVERAARAEKEATEKVQREQREAVERAAKEAAAREADKAHKTKINRTALEAFKLGGLTEEQAKIAVTLIAGKKIPAVIIYY